MIGFAHKQSAYPEKVKDNPAKKGKAKKAKAKKAKTKKGKAKKATKKATKRAAKAVTKPKRRKPAASTGRTRTMAKAKKAKKAKRSAGKKRRSTGAIVAAKIRKGAALTKTQKKWVAKNHPEWAASVGKTAAKPRPKRAKKASTGRTRKAAGRKTRKARKVSTAMPKSFKARRIGGPKSTTFIGNFKKNPHYGAKEMLGLGFAAAVGLGGCELLYRLNQTRVPVYDSAGKKIVKYSASYGNDAMVMIAKQPPRYSSMLISAGVGGASWLAAYAGRRHPMVHAIGFGLGLGAVVHLVIQGCRKWVFNWFEPKVLWDNEKNAPLPILWNRIMYDQSEMKVVAALQKNATEQGVSQPFSFSAGTAGCGCGCSDGADVRGAFGLPSACAFDRSTLAPEVTQAVPGLRAAPPMVSTIPQGESPPIRGRESGTDRNFQTTTPSLEASRSVRLVTPLPMPAFIDQAAYDRANVR